MRSPIVALGLLLLLAGSMPSCKKWQDPAPQDNPQISNPYCNDPDAVNYNWGFPGKPDNSVCYYATDLFQGRYLLHDTIYDPTSELFLAADSMEIVITRTDKKKMYLDGFCPSGQKLYFTTQAAYLATADTTVGDSLTIHPGQIFCRPQDTVVGALTRDKVDSSLIYVSFTVVNDTGTTIHVGRARRK